MGLLTTVKLNAPYLIMIGDVEEKTFAKTGSGIIQWRPDLVAGQLRFPECPINLGVPDMTVKQAAAAGVKSLILGVAPIGGVVPDPWWEVIAEAAEAGLDIVCGLHLKLSDNPALAAAANRSGARLIDVRNPPAHLPVGSGRQRTGRRLLTVGTDCGVGKKYSALALDQAMEMAGINSTFRATGQTGIMIAGEGIPIDAVVADFVSGAAELLSPDNQADHWDVIEGQGSLFHPGYAGVSLGLLHGSQPDAIVLCHDATRTHVGGWPEFALPTLKQGIAQYLMMGQLTNSKIQCVGLCVNTSDLPDADQKPYLAALATEVDLPCVDPILTGCDDIVALIQDIYPTT